MLLEQPEQDVLQIRNLYGEVGRDRPTAHQCCPDVRDARAVAANRDSIGVADDLVNTVQLVQVERLNPIVAQREADRRVATVAIDQLGRRARIQDASPAHRYNSVAQRLRFVQLMGNEEHAHTVAPQPGHC